MLAAGIKRAEIEKDGMQQLKIGINRMQEQIASACHGTATAIFRRAESDEK